MRYVALTSGPTPPVIEGACLRPQPEVERPPAPPSSVATAAACDGIAASGDNFRTVGPWRVLTGNGWRRWQLRARAAELAASRCSKDFITAARQVREQKARGVEDVSHGDNSVE